MSMLNTIKYIDKNSFDIHVLCGFIDDSLRHHNDYLAGIKIITINTLVRDICIWKDVLAFVSIFSLLRKGKYDIVHCHTSKAGFIGRVAAKAAGIKVVIYAPHGNIFYGYFGRLKTKFFVLLERVGAGFADKIVTLTERGIEPYLQFKIGTRDKYTHIYNGIDVDAFFLKGNINVEQKRRELGLLPEALVGTIIGRLVPVKGHNYLIDSILKVIKVFPASRFLFVGEGVLMSQIVDRVKVLGLEKHIIFLGMRDDVAEILACSDVSMLSSLNEGFGLVLLEAMAMKKPVVATSVDGVPEIVDDGVTGILVPPKDPGAFADALIKLFRDKGCAEKMGLNGYEKVKKEFDINVTTKKIEDLYYDQMSGTL